MAADSINTFVLAFPDPLAGQASGSLERVNGSLSYRLYQDSNIRTLSTNTASSGNDPAGLLYVPDLLSADPCVELSGTYIPQSATRQSNLPENYDLIALAPWISADCTLSYLASARADMAKAFIFYLTDNSTSQPPAISDRAWGLNDGGQWKSINQYPVYAIPGRIGDTIMRELSHYSGNVTNVTNGDHLSQIYDRREYIRLYTEIDTASRNLLPSLWVFLLIIAAVLLAILATTSLVMHWIQRRHRRNLRRRVANGEVDLEVLGIKRLRVPNDVLEKMPLFVYVADEKMAPHIPALTDEVALCNVSEGQPETMSEKPEAAIASSATLRRNSDPAHLLVATPVRPPSPIEISSVTNKEYAPLTPPLPPSPGLVRNKNRSAVHSMSDLPHRVLPYSQSTCSICLDDFDSHNSVVRELPCEHVFHPECVDTFLKTSSSLCPLCKKSVLPVGYCPDTLTNAMVRRERMARRSRERSTAVSGINSRVMPVEQTQHEPETGRADRIHWHVGRVGRLASGGRRIFSAPTPSTVEMGNVQAPLAAPLPVQRAPTQNRREWARRRASAMVGHSPTVEEEEQARQATLPKCKPFHLHPLKTCINHQTA
ncbi:MAG: hypothetical protein M1835_003914 [Candelina submexicana]|nr:MAG: hypothetical protein M1835_003914 [Candelina submexicana]